MSPLMGMLLVLGLMILIFLGPEWGVRFTRKQRKFRRLVRLGNPGGEPVAGRRKSNRIEGAQGNSQRLLS